MSKELFIQAHEELVEQYLEQHPNVTWSQAYEATADSAWGLAREKYANRIDQARQRMKDNWS